MKRYGRYVFWSLAIVFFISVCPASGDLVVPYITGTSTATEIVGGARDGWYYYEMSIEWDLDGAGAGLSHLDLVLGVECAGLDHLVEFDSPAGYSTTELEPSNPTAMGWTGYFNRTGDPTGGITNPALKYNDPYVPAGSQPGPDGFGTFSFYSNVIPEYRTLTGVLFAKSGSGAEDVFGDLTGAYPSCTIIPEPTTLFLLGFGGLLIGRIRRRFGQ